MGEGIENPPDQNAIELKGIVSVIGIIGIQNKKTERANAARTEIKKGVEKEMREDRTEKKVKNGNVKGRKDLAGLIEAKNGQKVDQNLQTQVLDINIKKVKQKRKKRVTKSKLKRK